MNVTVFQWLMGASASSRSPRGFQPFRRTIVDEHEASSVKPTLFANPTSARTSHVGSLALRRPQLEDASASTPPEMRWFWSIMIVPAVPNLTNGHAATIDEAMAKFRDN